MSGTRSSIAVGVFTDRRQARKGVADLKQAGFRDEKIGVAAKGHDEVTTTTADKKGTHVGEGATVGVAAGACLGALWALGIVAGRRLPWWGQAFTMVSPRRRFSPNHSLTPYANTHFSSC